MKRRRIKEVRNVNAHIALLLVFALLALIPFIPNEITGSSIIFFNDSDSNATEIITEVTSEINISIELNETTIISNETVENTTIENITELNETTIEINISNETESNITEQNVTEEQITIPEQNITETPAHLPEANTTTPIENTTQPEENVTEQVAEVNVSAVNTTINETNGTEEKIMQYQAVIGQPVKWKKTIKLDQESSNLEIELPKDAKITSIKKIEDNQSIDITQEEALPAPSLLTGLFAITGFAIFEEPDSTSLIIEQNVTEVEIEYETEAPTLTEEEIKGGVRLTLSSETHYENVYAEINISESRGELIRLYWVVNGTRILQPIIDYDDNNFNGFIDEIAFIAPHLSTEVFELIYITKAEHLDENYTFISDIYNETVVLDDTWSEPIYNGEYVRVTFEKNLTSDNDITFYARNNQSLNTTVEVYLYNTSIKIAEFPIISETKYYKINLIELNNSYATFDLKMNNLEGNSTAYLEFDYIIDPTVTVIQGNEAHDVGFAIMNERVGEIVMAWCDDVADNAFWEGFYTNGSNFTAKHPIQITSSDDCRIGVSALNDSDFALALIDQATVAAPDWVVYAKTKTNGSIRQRTVVDTDVNGTGGFDVAVAALNETSYVSIVADGTDNDVTYSIHNRAAGTTQVDLDLSAAIDAGCLDQDCVDIATIGNISSGVGNRTRAMVWYDDTSDDIKLAIMNGNNQNITGATQSYVIVDALSSGANSTAVSVTGLYDGRIVVAWCDDADQDVSFKTYDVAINSSVVSNVSGEVDVNLTSGSCAGPVGTKVDVAALNTTDGQFVIAWDDARINQTSIAVYDSSGASILAQTIISSPSSTNEKAISVIGYDVMRNVSVCAFAPLPVFTVAYDNSTDFIWETYLSNGSAWNGTCVSPSPIAILSNPPDATNNLSNSHVFFSTATDDLNLVNATLYHNISGSWLTNQTVGRNGTSNTSSFNVSNIPFGTYLWNVEWCDNSSQCAFADSNFTFTVAQCGSINDSYTIDSNRTDSTILANTSCMTITADNLDISCTNGATLIGNSMRGVAFNVTGRTNITIRGCVVEGFNTSVFFSRTNFSLIDNNTFRNNSAAGVHLLLSSDYNRIQNNTITSLANGSSLILSAVRLIGSSNNNITNNTINNNASAAIQLITGSYNNSIVNNNVSSNDSSGILIDGTANFTLVENNTIFSNNSIPLFSRSNSNNSFINNTATSTGHDAISISGQNDTIFRNIGTANGPTNGDGFDGNLGLHNSTIRENIFLGGPLGQAFAISGSDNLIFNNSMTSRSTQTNTYAASFGGSNNIFRNNTVIAVNETGLYLSAAYTSNITGNLITSIGGDGLRIEYVSNNTFNDNEIRTNSSFAIRILADPEIEESFNNSFNNTILKTNNSWIETSNSSRQNNFSNTSFIMPRGRIVILPRITIGNLTNVTLANLNVTQNISYINSTAIPVFNTSAIIALNGVTFTDPRPTIDTEEDGTFRNCNAPECNELSFTGNVFTFNTTHFTSHSASETSNSAPTITRVDINSTNPALNDTNQSIIAYPINVTDSDGDRVQNITNWFVNGTSFALVNLPFETNITSGADNIKDYSPLSNNGTLLGNTIWTNTSDCVRGGCYRFDGNGDSINVSADNDLGFTNRQNFTISAWINSTASTGIASATGIVAHYHNDNNGWVLSYIPSGQRINFLISGTGVTTSLSSAASSAPINKTNFVVARWETINSSSANMSLWVNGRLSTSFDTSINLSSSLKNLTIGDNYGAYFNGTIDEILIFNRSLSRTQIEALNSSSGNWLNITADETGSVSENWSACITPNDGTTDGTTVCSQNLTILDVPTITLNNPPNGTINSTHQHLFNSTVSDETLLVNATLYHNISGSWVANQTATLTGIGAGTNFLVANIPSGGYIWNVLACNQYNQCAFASSNFTFTINDNPNNISLINPPNATSNDSTSHIFFSNASDDRQLANATLYHNINGTFAGNQSVAINGTFNTSNFNVSNIADGTYTWNVLWCDTDSNCSFAASNSTFTVSTAVAGAAPSGGGNTASSAGRTQTILQPKPQIVTPPTEGRINITQSPIRIRNIIAGTIKTQLPLKVRTIDWGLLLILAIALVIWIIKKELKQLKKYEVKAERVSEDIQTQAHKTRLHIFREIVKAKASIFREIAKTLTKSVRIVAVSIEDISHAIGITIYAIKRRRTKLARLAALTKARYVRSLEKTRLLITIKQLKEEKLLALEKARRERLARLELLKKRQLEIKNRIEAIRTKLLQSVSLTEKEISGIESVFKSPLPYVPELQPHPEVKYTSEYENNSREFVYLYNKIDAHIKENDLTTAKETYDALILIFNRLLQETNNKYELISTAKEIQSRLSLAILSARAREKIEEYKALNTEIEIEKLPLQKKYRKDQVVTEEELQIDYLKALLKKNNYKKAIALYNNLYKENKKLISIPKEITPIEIEKIKNIKYKKVDNLPAESELKFDYLRQLLKDNDYKKAIELYKSINPNFSRRPIKTPARIKSIELTNIQPHHYKKVNTHQEDLRLSYLRELLKKNEYKEAIKLYENIYHHKKELIKKPKKVEPVFIEDIEPIKYEKLGENPSESELNIDSLRKLLKNNDYKTARKIFNKVFKE